MPKKIGVLLGGLSAEREISLKTGYASLRALQQLGYAAVAIDVQQNLPQQLQEASIEIAFIALHGRFGEDGRVQGMLEMLQIPYTGSGVLASSMAIDKVMTKQLLIYHELPTPQFDFMRPGDSASDLFQRCNHLPLVVKPSREGSTIGIT
ncbi:MAG: D-alanine--D-alanine ligase, partial [Desulfuromusa sp.]|nr:D-alanine--D-alanine ligase [Desulfuromusa sp.]